jgi:hypothetical protein
MREVMHLVASRLDQGVDQPGNLVLRASAMLERIDDGDARLARGQHRRSTTFSIRSSTASAMTR